MNKLNSSPTLYAGAELSQADAAVILIHGRGSSGRDIMGLASAIAAPGVAFAAPSAAGGSWYPQRFFAPLAANEPALSAALATIEAEVERALEAGIEPERVGLVGFSQGACLALEFAARRGGQLGFVAALSGGLIGPLDQPRTSVDLRGTPMLVACAEHDAHIPMAHVVASTSWLGAHGAAVTERIKAGDAHRVFPEDLDWIAGHVQRLAGVR